MCRIQHHLAELENLNYIHMYLLSHRFIFYFCIDCLFSSERPILYYYSLRFLTVYLIIFINTISTSALT
jgi:hypothetical protein